MFWFLESQMAYVTTELADIQFQTLLATGFMHPQYPWTASPLHRHLTCELYFVGGGQCTAHCDDRDYVCNPSDLLLINTGTRHHVSQMSEDTVLHSLQFSIFQIDKQDSPLYSQLCDKLSSPILLRGQDKLLLLFKQLRHECALQQPLYEPTVDASLYELSLRLRVSVSQTRRLVKKYYGVSFQEKLIQAKLERSQHLMKNPDLSLKAVAEQAGYGSYNAFFEAFTAHTGQTPSQYRQTRSNNQV